MKEKSFVVVDTNGWFQLLEGLKTEENIKKFTEYYNYEKYRIILLEIVMDEFSDILSKPSKWRKLPNLPKYYFKRFIRLANNEDIKFWWVEYKEGKTTTYYLEKAEEMIKISNLNQYYIPKKKVLHDNDLAIFLALKDKGIKKFKFFSGDRPLMEALRDENIMKVLKEKGFEITLIEFQRELQNN